MISLDTLLRERGPNRLTVFWCPDHGAPQAFAEGRNDVCLRRLDTEFLKSPCVFYRATVSWKWMRGDEPPVEPNLSTPFITDVEVVEVDELFFPADDFDV